jgi:hypothetical protein
MLVNPELLRAFAGQVDHATAAMSGVNVDGTVLGSVLTVLVVATVTALSLGLPAQELLTASMRKNPSRLGRRRPECSDSRRAPSPKSLATLVTTDTFSGSLARAGGWPGSMCPLDGVPFLRSSSVGRTMLWRSIASSTARQRCYTCGRTETPLSHHVRGWWTPNTGRCCSTARAICDYRRCRTSP